MNGTLDMVGPMESTSLTITATSARTTGTDVAVRGAGTPEDLARLLATLAACLGTEVPPQAARSVGAALALAEASGVLRPDKAAILAAGYLLRRAGASSSDGERRHIAVGADAADVLVSVQALDEVGDRASLCVVADTAAAAHALRRQLQEQGIAANRCLVVETALPDDAVDTLTLDAAQAPGLFAQALRAAVDGTSAGARLLICLPPPAAPEAASAQQTVNETVVPGIGDIWDLLFIVPGLMLLRRRAGAVTAQPAEITTGTWSPPPRRSIGGRLLRWLGGGDLVDGQELRRWQERCSDLQLEFGRALNQANVLILGQNALTRELDEVRTRNAAAMAEMKARNAALNAQLADSRRQADAAVVETRARVAALSGQLADSRKDAEATLAEGRRQAAAAAEARARIAALEVRLADSRKDVETALAERATADADARQARIRLQRLEQEAAEALNAQRAAQERAEEGLRTLSRRLADLAQEKIALERELREAVPVARKAAAVAIAD